MKRSYAMKLAAILALFMVTTQVASAQYEDDDFPRGKPGHDIPDDVDPEDLPDDPNNNPLPGGDFTGLYYGTSFVENEADRETFRDLKVDFGNSWDNILFLVEIFAEEATRQTDTKAREEGAYSGPVRGIYDVDVTLPFAFESGYQWMEFDNSEDTVTLRRVIGGNKIRFKVDVNNMFDPTVTATAQIHLVAVFGPGGDAANPIELREYHVEIKHASVDVDGHFGYDAVSAVLGLVGLGGGGNFDEQVRAFEESYDMLELEAAAIQAAYDEAEASGTPLDEPPAFIPTNGVRNMVEEWNSQLALSMEAAGKTGKLEMEYDADERALLFQLQKAPLVVSWNSYYYNIVWYSSMQFMRF